MKVIVVGAGPGACDLYTERAISAIGSADLVLTTGRLAESLSSYSDRVRIMKVGDTIEFILKNRDSERTVCVAASGDTGFYSIASTIAARVGRQIEVEFICGLGSLSYFASRLKTGYEDMKLVSLHGQKKSIVPYVCYNRRVFALTGGTIKAHHLAAQLFEAGLKDVTMHIGENLSADNERILSGKPEDFLETEFSDLCVVVVENKNYVNRYKSLRDEDFIRGKRPMTKESIRALVLSALEITPQDVVYDIGAGTGSVTCAMALKACESTVFAIEKDAEGVQLVKKNMEKTGARNIVIRCGTAPTGLSEFPPANKVFIGGSTGNLKEIIHSVFSRGTNPVIVMTAVSLETLSQATTLFREMDMETEIICVNVSTAQKLGKYHLMKAENPVYIIRGKKNCNEGQ